MPGTVTAALAEPIRRLQALVGPGWSAGPTGDPAAGLRDARDALAETAAAAGHAWRATDGGWRGSGADAAAEFAAATTAAIDGASERAGSMGVVAGQAAEAVAHARRRLQDILDEFEVVASALESRLDSPGVARELLAAAREALRRAIAVVEELLGELDRQAAALDAHAPGAAPTVPAGAGDAGSGGYSPSAGFAPGAGGFAPGSSGGASGGAAPWNTSGGQSSVGEWAAFTHGVDGPDAASFGEGVEIRLPDGSIVLAPNAAAADAVRHALTQLGVPYQWGGTTPGVGLDCSGLTQWAYREAGLSIPRLAQEQDIGAAIAPGDLRPGDLAVWDGHVAMVVGNGTMIEAGDPVKLSPIRTSNAGQGFQGFWRPTA